MSEIFSQLSKRNIFLILFLLVLIIPQFLFSGTIDDFIPKHIASIVEITHTGKLYTNDDFVIQTPGFYILGAIITLTSNLDPENLMSFPIQLLPYSLLFFLILNKLSNNYIFSCLITLVDVCSGTTGTLKIFFWPHGIGYILFFSTLLLIMILLIDRRRTKSICILLVIILSSQVYMSYNLTAMSFLFIGLLTTILFILHLLSIKKDQDDLWMIWSLLLISIIICTVQFGLSKFFYLVFIPTLKSSQNLEISSMDKILIAYFQQGLSTTPLSSIMVNYPPIISIISSVKYFFLFITILLFCFWVIKSYSKVKNLDSIEIFLLAIIVMFIIYSIPRLIIGGVTITLIWLPGILCATYFFQKGREFKLWAILIIIIIIISTPIYYYIMEISDNVDRDEYQFDSYKIPVTWLNNYNTGSTCSSDEYTKNFFILNSLKNSIIHGNFMYNYYSISQKHKILPVKDAQILVHLSEDYLAYKYYILNKRLNSMSLQNWIYIKSWTKSEIIIDSIGKVNKIYEVPLLSIYSTY